MQTYTSGTHTNLTWEAIQSMGWKLMILKLFYTTTDAPDWEGKCRPDDCWMIIEIHTPKGMAVAVRDSGTAPSWFIGRLEGDTVYEVRPTPSQSELEADTPTSAQSDPAAC